MRFVDPSLSLLLERYDQVVHLGDHRAAPLSEKAHSLEGECGFCRACPSCGQRGGLRLLPGVAREDRLGRKHGKPLLEEFLEVSLAVEAVLLLQPIDAHHATVVADAEDHLAGPGMAPGRVDAPLPGLGLGDLAQRRHEGLRIETLDGPADLGFLVAGEGAWGLSGGFDSSAPAGGVTVGVLLARDELEIKADRPVAAPARGRCHRES